MSKKQINIIALSSILSLSIFFMPQANAMHIMEGYLPASYCVTWGILCLPFLLIGLFTIKQKINENRKSLVLLAMSGAFIFLISSLKIPSVTGSCSHMTGTGLGAILFGPFVVSILGIIVLLFQAILLAHGGLTTLGANCFSMAVAGPIITFIIFKVCKKFKINRLFSVFLASSIGDLFTYCITAFQLAIAHPASNGGIYVSFAKFLAVFAPTQLPLAILEGILTVLIIISLESYAKKELKTIGYVMEA